MQPDHPTPPRRHLRAALLIMVVVGFAAWALGLGDVVRAAFDPPAAVKPYDPMERW